MKRPLAVLCLMFAAGVWIADVLTSVSPQIAAVCAAFAAGAAAVFFVAGKKHKTTVKHIALPVVVMSAALAAGVLRGWTEYKLWTEPALSQSGKQSDMLVTGYPDKSQYGWIVPVKLLNVQTALFTEDMPDVKPGDTAAALVNISEYRRGGYALKAVQAGMLEIRKAGRVPLLMYPAKMRHELIARIETLFPQNADFASALVTGDRSGFSDAFKNALAVTGLSHTAAISGLHISFITGIFIWLFGGVRRAAPFAVPFIILFTAVAGFPPSAVRAAVMNILMLSALLLNRDYDARVSLSAALALILFVRPEAALDVGLQLSFASTFGIISFAGVWSAYLFEKLPALRNKYTRWIVKSLSTTAAALIFTVPLTAYYFGTVSLSAPVSNLLALPVISVLFTGSLAAAGISYIFMPAAKMTGLFFDGCYGLLKRLINTISEIPFSALYVSETMVLALLVFQYTILAICYVSWRKGGFRPIMPFCMSVCAVCAVILSTTLYYDHSNTLRVTAVDVGQGQSLVFSTKSRTVVVDCGGVNAGEETVKYVLSQGASSIDALVLTHCHADHANGVETLLERVEVGVVIMPESDEGISEIAGKTGTPVIVLENDGTVQMGECELRLIVPRDGGDVNERCMSVLTDYNGFTMLVTGDLSGESERRLLRFAEIPELDLYMVGHHGSKYSTCDTLLYYTNPKAAIISTGANTYGHPAAETLSRLEEYGAEIFRTDLHGNITVTVGGD